MIQNYVLEYIIRNAKETQEGLKLNRLHQLLVYAVDVNLLDENTNTTKYKETLIDPSKEVGLEFNEATTRCVFMLRQQNATQNRNINRDKTYFGNVAKFKYLEMTVKN